MAVFEPPNVVDVLVEQLQIYRYGRARLVHAIVYPICRDKEDIFFKATYLLRLGCKLPQFAEVL